MTGRPLSLRAVKLTLRARHGSSGTDDLADSDEEGLRQRWVTALREGSRSGLERLDARRQFTRMDDGDTAWTAD
ncbi:MAG: hypothetical protein H7062_00075 [Candidatus Saccharimonas sp.]|nr:hypothetical protein [Planctomycetaceae bacterium]